jgi:hypothetical protein
VDVDSLAHVSEVHGASIFKAGVGWMSVRVYMGFGSREPERKGRGVVPLPGQNGQ